MVEDGSDEVPEDRMDFDTGRMEYAAVVCRSGEEFGNVDGDNDTGEGEEKCDDSIEVDYVDGKMVDHHHERQVL